MRNMDAFEALQNIRDRVEQSSRHTDDAEARLIIEEQRLLLENAVQVINELRHSKKGAGLQAMGWKRQFAEMKQRRRA